MEPSPPAPGDPGIDREMIRQAMDIIPDLPIQARANVHEVAGKAAPDAKSGTFDGRPRDVGKSPDDVPAEPHLSSNHVGVGRLRDTPAAA